MADGAVEPRGGLLIDGREILRCGGERLLRRPAQAALRRDGIADGDVHADICRSLIRRLAGICAVQAQVLDRHVLVPGEENIKAELIADAAALIFIRHIQRRAGAQVILKAAVIDADREVDLLLF